MTYKSTEDWSFFGTEGGGVCETLMGIILIRELSYQNFLFLLLFFFFL